MRKIYYRRVSKQAEGSQVTLTARIMSIHLSFGGRTDGASELIGKNRYLKSLTEVCPPDIDAAIILVSVSTVQS